MKLQKFRTKRHFQGGKNKFPWGKKKYVAF